MCEGHKWNVRHYPVTQFLLYNAAHSKCNPNIKRSFIYRLS